MRALLLGAALLGLAGASEALAQAERAGRATHYGVSFHGRTMGCGGRYSTYDPTIIAVPPSMYQSWPCGTALVVSGPYGAIVGTRQDSCPGCDRAGVVVDLSEAGIARVCGPRASSCQVTVGRYVAPPPAPEPEPELPPWPEPERLPSWDGWWPYAY